MHTHPGHPNFIRQCEFKGKAMLLLHCLPRDVFLSISHFLELADILNLTALARGFCELLNTDDFFMAVAYDQFSSEFWRRASQRTQPPCKTIKAELMRIERFQRMVVKHDGKRWKEQDFFRMWSFERPRVVLVHAVSSQS